MEQNETNETKKVVIKDPEKWHKEIVVVIGLLGSHLATMVLDADSSPSEQKDVANTISMLIKIDQDLGYLQLDATQQEKEVSLDYPDDTHEEIVRYTRFLGLHMAHMAHPYKGYEPEMQDVARTIQLLDDFDQEMGYPSDPKNP